MLEETPIPQQLEPISADQIEVSDLALGPQEPLRQYCVFRAGRERFCFRCQLEQMETNLGGQSGQLS